MAVSVIFALCARGSPNAITPFDTASTPVIAAHPLEKVFMMSQRKARPRIFSLGPTAGGVTSATGCP